MKFSSSNKKHFLNNSNKQFFLSNKRQLISASSEKNKNKKSSNNKNNNKINLPLNTVIKNQKATIECQNDIIKIKASSKKSSNLFPPKLGDRTNINSNSINYNYGCFSNSSLDKSNKSAYIESIKKNLLPSLSKELKSNSKNKSQNNINEKNFQNNNNVLSTINKPKNYTINKYNNSELKKKNNNEKYHNSSSKSIINTSSKKTANDSTPNDYLFKITETIDLEKMVDYIVSNTKIYNRYNDNKEKYTINNINKIINLNEGYDNNNIINFSTRNKKIRKIKKNICEKKSVTKSLNNHTDNPKIFYSICKCKKVECLKYSCSCLKSGNKCNSLCSCMNCKNKDKNNNIFKIEEIK